MRIALAAGLAFALAAAWLGIARYPFAGARGAFQVADVTLPSTPGRLRLRDGSRPTLLVFGYTRCTDTCPVTMASLSRLLSSWRGPGVAPRAVFVDIDPWEDDAATVARYIARFPRVAGARGDMATLEAVSSSLGLPPVRDKDALMWHDARIFVLDGRGVLLGSVVPDAQVSVLADALRQLLAR